MSNINPELAVCNFNSEYKVSYIMACINFEANNYNARSDWLVPVGHYSPVMLMDDYGPAKAKQKTMNVQSLRENLKPLLCHIDLHAAINCSVNFGQKLALI